MDQRLEKWARTEMFWNFAKTEQRPNILAPPNLRRFAKTRTTQVPKLKRKDGPTEVGPKPAPWKTAEQVLVIRHILKDLRRDLGFTDDSQHSHPFFEMLSTWGVTAMLEPLNSRRFLAWWHPGYSFVEKNICSKTTEQFSLLSTIITKRENVLK